MLCALSCRRLPETPSFVQNLSLDAQKSVSMLHVIVPVLLHPLQVLHLPPWQSSLVLDIDEVAQIEAFVICEAPQGVANIL